jgi:hypothetical protein
MHNFDTHVSAALQVEFGKHEQPSLPCVQAEGEPSAPASGEE